MAQYSLFVLKVPLNPKQTNKQTRGHWETTVQSDVLVTSGQLGQMFPLNRKKRCLPPHQSGLFGAALLHKGSARLDCQGISTTTDKLLLNNFTSDWAELVSVSNLLSVACSETDRVSFNSLSTF